MQYPRLSVRVRAVCAIAALIVVLPAARSQAQTPPQTFPAYGYSGPDELDHMVSEIVLYPDPLLSQILGAATFPAEIAGAAQWADEHHYLSGDDLAHAMAADHLPWDPSVQALLPFPSLLERMAANIDATATLGGAFLAQREDLMDSLQRMRKRARDYGFLRTNPLVFVSAGAYVEIELMRPDVVVVPRYDPSIVFERLGKGCVLEGAIDYGTDVRIGNGFRPWGWTDSQFDWAGKDMSSHRPASQWEPESRVEMHVIEPQSTGQRDAQEIGLPPQAVSGVCPRIKLPDFKLRD